MTEPCDLPAVTARALIGERKLSPVELLESCIHRIEAIDPAVNAVIARSFESARATAQASEAAVMRGDALGARHRLPLGVKDLIDAKGLPTSFGSVLFKDNIAAEDEAIVAMLRRAGAIVVGKTNVPEWGAGGNTRNALHGATGNPFDPERSAAGSSGGSAVALATGMVPLATGSDTGGSLRNPASFCGVVGFRPSPGMVAVERRAMGWTPISVLGPMGRSVADVCLLYATQIGQHDSDPLSFPLDPMAYAEPWPVDLGSLRVAYTEDYGGAPVEKGIRKAFREKIKAMKHLFRSVDQVEVDYGGADRCFDVVRAVSFLSRYHDLYTNNRE